MRIWLKDTVRGSRVFLESKQGLIYSLVLILFIAFLLRMATFQAMVEHPERFFQIDSYGKYQPLALNLVQFHQFGTFDENGIWTPEVERTPGYPTFLAAVYSIFGIKPAAVILVQILMSTLLIALAYYLGRLWGGVFVGVILAVFISIELAGILYANQLLTETLFNTIFLASMIVWSLILKQKQWKYGVLAGIVFGLATLIRPIVLYFSIIIGLLSLLLYPGSKKERLVAVFTIILSFVLTITPWMIRNYSITGNMQLTSLQAETLLFYNVRQLRAAQQGISTEVAAAQLLEEAQQECSYITQGPSGELATCYQQKAISEIRTHWAEYTVLHLKGSAMFFIIPTSGTIARALGWLPDRGGTGLLANLMTRNITDTLQFFLSFQNQLSEAGYNIWLFFVIAGYEIVLLLLLTIGWMWGIIRCFTTKRWDVLLVTLTVIGYFALITGPVSYDARYRLPVMPFLVLLAALAIYPLNKIKKFT